MLVREIQYTDCRVSTKEDLTQFGWFGVSFHDFVYLLRLQYDRKIGPKAWTIKNYPKRDGPAAKKNGNSIGYDKISPGKKRYNI